MSATSDLKAYYIAQAEYITDEGDKLEALAAIDRWYNCRLAIDSLSASDVASYSIGGRSVTRKPLSDLRNQEATLVAEVKQWIGRGGGGLVDTSDNMRYFIR